MKKLMRREDQNYEYAQSVIILILIQQLFVSSGLGSCIFVMGQESCYIIFMADLHQFQQNIIKLELYRVL